MKVLLRWPIRSLFFGLLIACGCETSVGPGSHLDITPNGKFIVWTREKHTFRPMGAEARLVKEARYVCWAAADCPARPAEMLVLQRTVAGYGPEIEDTHLSVSPDSRHLGVISGKDILIIDMESGEHWSMSPHEAAGSISSFGWLGQDHFGYVTYTVPRKFWRRSLSDPSQKPDVIYQDPNVEGSSRSKWPFEYWSPDGRHVVFEGARGDTQLLSTETGAVRKLSEWSGELRASWKPDSSAVVWTTSRMRYGRPGNYSTYMLDLGEGEVVDLSDEFSPMFGIQRPEYEPLWTADGNFLVGSDLSRGGYLIQPRPWTVVPIGEILRKEEGLGYAPWIRRQIASGLVVARSGPDHTWVMNYAGEVLQDLPSDGVFEWTVFPDGQKAAMLDKDMKIVIKKLDLPASERHENRSRR